MLATTSVLPHQHSGDRYTVPALARGLQLLMHFGRDARELSGAELSRRLGLPRASVFRMLQTLEQADFVQRAGDNGLYKLGPAVLRLGFEYLAAMELTEHGRPIIDELRDHCGYSAHIVVRDGRDVVFIAKAPSRNTVFHSIQVGARLPAHATVLGQLLLADLDDAALKHLYPEAQLASHTALTPTSIMALKTKIGESKSRGYGVSQGGFDTGISTIAAPVFNARHEVVAAVSIAVPAQQVRGDELSPLIQQVRNAAVRLSQHMHHSHGDWQAHNSHRKAA